MEGHFSSSQRAHRLWGPPNALVSGCSRLKRPGRESDLSPPTGAEAEKSRCYILVPHKPSWSVQGILPLLLPVSEVFFALKLQSTVVIICTTCFNISNLCILLPRIYSRFSVESYESVSRFLNIGIRIPPSTGTSTRNHTRHCHSLFCNVLQQSTLAMSFVQTVQFSLWTVQIVKLLKWQISASRKVIYSFL